MQVFDDATSHAVNVISIISPVCAASLSQVSEKPVTVILEEVSGSVLLVIFPETRENEKRAPS